MCFFFFFNRIKIHLRKKKYTRWKINILFDVKHRNFFLHYVRVDYTLYYTLNPLGFIFTL